MPIVCDDLAEWLQPVRFILRILRCLSEEWTLMHLAVVRVQLTLSPNILIIPDDCSRIGNNSSECVHERRVASFPNWPQTERNRAQNLFRNSTFSVGFMTS